MSNISLVHQRIAMIRAHALNAKHVNPDSVDADDKLFLLSLLDRTAEARSQLFSLAAAMARCENMPSVEDWPERNVRQSARRAQSEAEEQCKQWALAVSSIARAL